MAGAFAGKTVLVTGGAAGLGRAYALRFGGEGGHLILADIGLPDESGLEVLHAVKRSDPSTRVVLVTGCENPPTPEQAMLEGAECLLLKPFALADLLTMVRRFTTFELDALGGPLLKRGPLNGPEPAV